MSMNKEILYLYSRTDDRNHFINLHQITNIDFIPNFGVILRINDIVDQRPLEFRDSDNPGLYDFLKSIVVSFVDKPSVFESYDKRAAVQNKNVDASTTEDIAFLN